MKAKKYMRKADPSIQEVFTCSEAFAREAGWVPVEEPIVIEDLKPEPKEVKTPEEKPKTEKVIDGQSLNLPNLDKPEEVAKPKATRKPRTKKAKK